MTVSVESAFHNTLRPPRFERRNAGLESLRFGLDEQGITRLDELLSQRRQLQKGEVLYRTGTPPKTLFAIRAGSFKTVSHLPTGRSQVTGYHIAGDIVGLAGIGEGEHVEDAIALEFSEVALIPFNDLSSLALRVPALQQNIVRVLGAAINRTKRGMLLLGSRTAEGRLASFLIDLSDRLRRCGYSSIEFNVPLTGAELGNMVGLTAETVSRLLGEMQKRGLIEKKGRTVKLVDLDALNQVATADRVTGH